MNRTPRLLLVTALLAGLGACHQKPQAATPKYETLDSGIVQHVKKNGFLLKDDQGGYSFVTLDGVDEKILKRLKKGEKVTLLGKVNPKVKKEDAVIEEIILQDGTHIPVR